MSRRRRRGRPRLVSVGDLVLDIVVAAESAIESGTDVRGAISFRAGGSAANTARGFAALGGEAVFLGAVGEDNWGRRLVAALRADGVRVNAPRVPRPTARLVAVLGPRGERSFITDRGAADLLAPAALRPALLARADAVHLPAYSLLREPLSLTAGEAARLGRDAGAVVSVDLASRRPLLEQGPQAARACLRAVAPDILFANHDEAAALAGGDQRSLLKLAPVVVVKEGQAGCRVMWRPPASSDVLEIDVATTPTPAADTTGAGDAFDAGFLYQLTSTSGGPPAERRPHELRRAAVAGHRAAGRLLSRPRRELIP